MVTTSSNRGFQVPTVAGDVGVWGGELNTTIAGLDTILGAQLTFNSSSAGTNVTVSSSQAQFSRLLILNTSSSPFQLNLPSSNFAQGMYSIGYASSQGQSLTVTAGSSTAGQTAVFSGSSAILLAGLNRLVYSLGIDAFFPDNAVPTTPVDIGLIVGGSSVTISSGLKGQIHIPFPLTIRKWWMMADQSGSITIDVIRANNAVPLSSQSIIGGSGNLLTLSSSQFNSAVPSSWASTTLNTDDFIDFQVNAASSLITRVSAILNCQRT